MSGEKTRAGLFGVVGAYLLYTAYGLFRGLGDPETTMNPMVQVLFIVFFLAVGIVLLVFAVRMWRRASREESEQLEEMRAQERAREQQEESAAGTDSEE